MADRVAVEYWVTLVEEGKDVALAGCSVLKLDRDARCTELRDYWAMPDGGRVPPTGWGV